MSDWPNYDVFASYAWSTAKGDPRVVKMVEQLRDVHGLNVFFDKDHIEVGNVFEELKIGIGAATVFIPFISEKYCKKLDGSIIDEKGRTDYCKYEFNAALVYHGAASTIPVVLDANLRDAATWGETARKALKTQVWVNYSDDNMLQSAAQQIADYVETVKTKPSKFKQRKDRIGVLADVDTFRIRSVPIQKASEFVANTRGWLFDRMNEWQSNPEWVPMFGILGPAGIGKSVIMARLCELGHWFEDGYVYTATQRLIKESKNAKTWRKSMQNGLKRFSRRKHSYEFLVAAAHFFKHDDREAGSAKHALLSVAMQLAENVPGFFDEVRENALKIDLNVVDVPEVFQRLLVEPMRRVDAKLGGFAGRILVAFDALDECVQGQKDLLKILQKTWREMMPSWVGTVLSARPQDRIPAAMREAKPAIIDMDDEANTEDMMVFLNTEMKPYMLNPDRDLKPSVEIILGRSEGLFIYGRFLQENLKLTGGGLTLSDVKEKTEIFPDRLDGFYGEYFERFKASVQNTSVLDLLGPMCVAREPLRMDIVSKLLGINSKTTQIVTMKAQQLLVVTGDEIRFVHKSMSDYLQDPLRNQNDTLQIDEQKNHEQLAAFCLESIEKSDFAARNAVFHMCEAGQRQKLSELLCNFTWLKAVLVDKEVNIWRFVADCEEFFMEKAGALVGAEFVIRALEKGLNGLSLDARQLGGQLHGRLEENHPILKTIPEDLEYSWVKPKFASLVPANHPVRKILEGHSDEVNSVAFDHDIIVSGSSDNTVKVWSKSSGELLQTIQSHSGFVMSVAVGHEVIVSGSDDKTVKVWSKSSGELLQTLEGHSNIVWSVAVDHDTIVSGSDDKTVKIWSNSSGKLLQTLEGHSGWVRSVAVDHDVIVSGSRDKTVKVWSKSSGELLQTWPGHSNDVNSVAVDGDVILSGSDDNTVKVWSKSSGGLLQTLKGHFEGVTSVAVDHDVIVSGSWDGTVKVWSKSFGELLPTLVEGHSDYVMSLAVDHDMIVSGSWDKTVKVWSKSSGELLQTLEGHSGWVRSVAVDDDIIVSGSHDKTVKVWSKSSGELLQTLEGHTSYVSSVAVDGDVITSCDTSRTTIQWSRHTFERLDPKSNRREESPQPWSYSGPTVSFSGDPFCVGLTLDGEVDEIATDDSGDCVVFDSVQRLHGPHVLQVVRI